jgi:hypothetical protein
MERQYLMLRRGDIRLCAAVWCRLRQAVGNNRSIECVWYCLSGQFRGLDGKVHRLFMIPQ